MVSTIQDEDFIREVHLYSGVPEADVLSVFEAVMIKVYMDLKEGKKLYYPYFGEFKVNHDGDELTNMGKEAKVSMFYSLHPQMKRLVGQISDEEKTGITKNDAIDLLMKITKSDLRTKIEDD